MISTKNIYDFFANIMKFKILTTKSKKVKNKHEGNWISQSKKPLLTPKKSIDNNRVGGGPDKWSFMKIPA